MLVKEYIKINLYEQDITEEGTINLFDNPLFQKSNEIEIEENKNWKNLNNT